MNRNYSLLKNRILFLLAFIMLIMPGALSSQTSSFRVLMKDKGPEKSFLPGSAIYDSALAYHNQRCLDRRRKVLPADSLLTIEDAPVYYKYVESVSQTGARVLLKLRWNNYLVVSCDSAAAETIRAFDFVKLVQPASSKFRELAVNNSNSTASVQTGEALRTEDIINCGVFEYGESFYQANLMDVPPVHAMGFTGAGILVGFIDSGFRWRDHDMLSNSSVLAEYDFIFNDTLTDNEPVDDPRQISHGTEVFSTVAGFMPGRLIGISPNSQFMLAKTEDLRSETRVEEDNYAAAIEWLESRGADITTSSLGYFVYDSLVEPYSYSELDGRTTVSARALNDATKRGMLCLTAAGNSGPGLRTIITPSDADSALAVGAALENGLLPAGFTSRGPRGDGLIKPDISARGVKVVAANPNTPDQTVKVSGTSLATPLLAGAAALVLSAFPEIRPYELRNLLFSNSSLFPVKDTALGYGIPDIFKAMKSYSIAISPVITYKIMNFRRVASFILSSGRIDKAELNVRFSGSPSFVAYPMYLTAMDNLFAADLPDEKFNGQPAEAYITASNPVSSRRYPFTDGSTVLINPETDLIPCGVDLARLPSVESGISASFIYPSVVESGSTAELSVPLTKKSSLGAKIFNTAGQELFSYFIDGREAGIANIPIHLDGFATGAYFIIVSLEGRIDKVKFVVIK